MNTAMKSEFLDRNGAIKTAKAIEAGRDARTAAIIECAYWIAVATKAAFNRICWAGMLTRQSR